jgi:hypothetical protein
MTGEHVMSIDNEQTQTIMLKETLPAPGLGDKNSPISKVKYETNERGETIPGHEQLSADLYEIIKSGDCIKTCTHYDDGCLDGRCAVAIAYPTNGQVFETKAVQNNGDNERAKVAGGGYITGLAMYRALYDSQATVTQDLALVTAEFTKQGIYCGAHTGANGSQETAKTDCGANDRLEEIMRNGTRYANEVAGVASELIKRAGQSYNPDAMSVGFDGWMTTLDGNDYLVDSNGVTRLDAIKQSIADAQESASSVDDKVAVIKHLGGSHKEIRLVVVCEQGKTFSQTELMERHPDVDPQELPQVFVLDIWRIEELAWAVARIPKGGDEQWTDGELQDRFAAAYHAGVAYQVATYITLTDGSLPVDIFAKA